MHRIVIWWRIWGEYRKHRVDVEHSFRLQLTRFAWRSTLLVRQFAFSAWTRLVLSTRNPSASNTNKSCCTISVRFCWPICPVWTPDTAKTWTSVRPRICRRACCRVWEAWNCCLCKTFYTDLRRSEPCTCGHWSQNSSSLVQNASIRQYSFISHQVQYSPPKGSQSAAIKHPIKNFFEAFFQVFGAIIKQFHLLSVQFHQRRISQLKNVVCWHRVTLCNTIAATFRASKTRKIITQAQLFNSYFS